MRRLVLAVICGCYHPTVVGDVPCTVDFQCPDGQVCDQTRSPPTCVGALTDAASGSHDTMIDGEQVVMIDAPGAQCTMSSQCTIADQPFCDLGTNTCRACKADSECASDVCSESTGVCIDVSAALFVATNGSDGNLCTTEASPCLTITGALGKLTATRRTIRVADGNYSDSFVLVAANSPVTISGENPTYLNTIVGYQMAGFGTGAHDHVVEGTNMTLVIEGVGFSGATGAEATRMSGGGKLTLFEVGLGGSAGGIDCSTCTLVVEQSTIALDNGIGISSSGNNNTVTIDRSVVAGNTGTGIAVAGNYTITNTFVVANGGGGVSITNPGGTHRFDFNTVADNTGSTLPYGVHCGAAVELTNSIFSNNGSEPQLATNCTATYSLFTDSGQANTGDKNNASPAFISATNYHITSQSDARSSADPGSTEAVDCDGEVRPQGGARDMGADEIP